MARPKAKGVEYFPLDVGFLSDLKIRKIMLSHGPASIAVLIYIFAAIYKDEGYFMSIKDDEISLIALDTNLDADYVKQVINRACEVELFSFRIYDNFRILTSEGIQNRYLKITERRKSVKINADINLINADMMYTETRVNVTETGVNVTETGVNVYKNEQSKVKEIESKVNKSKEKSFMQPVFNNWINNFGDISSYLMEVLESLVLEYGVDEVLSALKVAKDKGTTNVKYIEGVLKNRKIQSYADDRKSAKKDEQVDWDKESARVHGT